jgi:tetratricopeptide (TPR) repeat protein
MKRLVVAMVLMAGIASDEPALIERVESVATSYHEDPTALDRLYSDLRRTAEREPRADVLVALARIAFVWDDVRATTAEQKLEAYDRGRQAARRALNQDPRSAAAHFWNVTNTARWGQAKGVVRSLALLPEIQRGIDTVLALDPSFAAAYALAGNVYYEVPALLGGDLAKAEAAFRKGLELDAVMPGFVRNGSTMSSGERAGAGWLRATTALWPLALARILYGYLWWQQSGWKVPSDDFGRKSGGGLWYWVQQQIQHPTLAAHRDLLVNVMIPNWTLSDGWC